MLSGHESAVSSLTTANADETGVTQVLVSGSFDTTIRIWKMTGDETSESAGWECSRVLKGHACYVHAVAAWGRTVYSAVSLYVYIYIYIYIYRERERERECVCVNTKHCIAKNKQSSTTTMNHTHIHTTGRRRAHQSMGRKHQAFHRPAGAQRRPPGVRASSCRPRWLGCQDSRPWDETDHVVDQRHEL